MKDLDIEIHKNYPDFHDNTKDISCLIDHSKYSSAKDLGGHFIERLGGILKNKVNT